VPAVSFSAPGGSTRQVILPTKKKESFDERTRTVDIDFDWGRVECAYLDVAGRLEMTVKVINTSRDVISSIQVIPLWLDLPKLHENRVWLVPDTGALLRHKNGSIALANWESRN